MAKKAVTKKKYHESHWLVFAGQGVIALGFGFFAILTDIKDVPALMVITSIVLASMGVIELVNVIHRKRHGHGWGATIVISLVELAVAAALFFTKDALYVTHISIIAGYALLRGIWELYLGLKALTDKTDKIMWTISGMIGAILGFVILADPGRSQTTFVQVFGTYIAILGLTNLIYSIHSHKTSSNR
jgi:uncharacterized membrane protein HdeD (DUF308 family)